MKFISILFIFGLLSSCTDLFMGEDIPSTPEENFNYLWKVIDQKYSFFEYKQVDWDEAYLKYHALIRDNMNDVELFSVIFSMLSELKDAHVNLISSFNTSRYDEVFKKAPENFDYRLIEDYYLRSDYFQTGPFQHKLINNGQIGYIRYASFSSEISKKDIDYIVNKYRDNKGIIIDIRSNTGGLVNNVFTFCSAFADQKRHVYTSYTKTGPGHEDFSAPNLVYIGPDSKIPYTKPVCILTNRSCYSATSFFILAMKSFPNVVTVGDTTGGGLGAPTGGELPNGWTFRYSCSRTISTDGINYENGMPPDKVVYMKSADVSKGIDTILEAAIKDILSR